MSSNERVEKIESTLRHAGLVDTAKQFPEDVLAAAEGAHRIRSILCQPADNTQEPWPAMRVGRTSCTG